jgi:hypothetical protein
MRRGVGSMTWMFREPFEPAIHGRRRAFAPQVVRQAYSRSRTTQAFDLFLEQAWPAQRRACVPPGVIRATTTAPFSAARRLTQLLIAAGVYDEIQSRQRPARHAAWLRRSGDDVGRSASFTVTFAGKGDDPYRGVAVAVTIGIALGVDTFRELAIQNGAVFGGSSAARDV